jgi:hypothetical protein
MSHKTRGKLKQRPVANVATTTETGAPAAATMAAKPATKKLPGAKAEPRYPFVKKELLFISILAVVTMLILVVLSAIF